MPEFQWLPLTWEAIATFFTGIAAVTGAYFIGRKQTKLTELQTINQLKMDEFSRQLRSDELKLQLLERRLLCIRAVQRASSLYVANVRFEPGELQDLLQAVQEAQLIFPDRLISGIQECAYKTMLISNKYRLQSSLRERGKEHEADSALNAALQMEGEVFSALPDLATAMISLARISDRY